MLRPYQNYLREFQSPPPEKRDKKKYLLWLAAFGVLYAATEDMLQNHTSMLVNGSLTPSQWGAAVLATLGHSHSVAYYQGAQSMGGDITPAEAQPIVSKTLREQAQFLSEFVADLEEGDKRYQTTLEQLYPEFGDEKDIMARIKSGDVIPPHPIEDEGDEYWNEKAINQRLMLYNERTRGTANWGAVDMLSPTEEIYWRLDPAETHHCLDCPMRAKNVYVKGTLPGVPGDGSTECKVYCKCQLELSDGTVVMF